jgi:PII-like signaling protein
MLKAQIYIDQDELAAGEPLYEFILKFLIGQKVKGATMFRGRLGYGEGQHLNRPNDLFSFDETPVMITFIDTEAKVRDTLTELRKTVKSGFIITQQVEIW